MIFSFCCDSTGNERTLRDGKCEFRCDQFDYPMKHVNFITLRIVSMATVKLESVFFLPALISAEIGYQTRFDAGRIGKNLIESNSRNQVKVDKLL